MKANSGARLGLLASVALLGLALAAEARAEDGSASSGDAASAVDPVTEDGSADEQAPPEPPPAEPPPTEPPLAEPPPAEPPLAEQPLAEQPPAEPPPTEQPPAEPPPAEPPPTEPPPPMDEEPPPAPPPADPPVVEPPLPDTERVPEVRTAPGSQRESIVTISRDASRPHLPLLFSSSGYGGAAVRLDTQSGSRSETRNEAPRAAESTGEAPLLPPLPFRGGAPTGLYVTGGGMGSGSSGGFFPLVLAGLIAPFAAAAQRRGGLVSLALAPPRCSAFVLCLERPD
jgi:outer membrane biosynthesis protein TonB